MTAPDTSTAAVLQGRPAGELTDEELEAQGTQAHATRNWVFLHGTADQFARHTSRMLELEQEYLRRYPHRTWQGSGGAPGGAGPTSGAPEDPVLAVLAAVAAAPGGRLHKLEVHQAAREAGLDRTSLAALYTSADPVLVVDQHDRVITESGRARLQEPARTSGRTTRFRPADWRWERDEHPTWDADRQRIVGGAPAGVFDMAHESGASLPGEWWALRAADGTTIGYGWMDLAWGDAEILLAVDPDVQHQGAGAAILEHLEQEAAERGQNYVYNTVAASHPRREYLHDWLGARGYVGSDQDETLRKRVRSRDSSTAGRRPSPVPRAGVPASTDESRGREDLGGYVDVEDHSY